MRGRAMLRENLKELIPRPCSRSPVQARHRRALIARETIAALRKDVTAKLLGRRTRRGSGASGQAEGGEEARCASFGKVEIPAVGVLSMR